jgi:hypothetical protein
LWWDSEVKSSGGIVAVLRDKADMGRWAGEGAAEVLEQWVRDCDWDRDVLVGCCCGLWIVDLCCGMLMVGEMVVVVVEGDVWEELEGLGERWSWRHWFRGKDAPVSKLSLLWLWLGEDVARFQSSRD